MCVSFALSALYPVFAVIQLFAQYMGSVSTVTTVKWLWFMINLAALGGVLMHLARIFKAGADAKGGEVAQLYGALSFFCFRSVWRLVVPARAILTNLISISILLLRAVRW
jgi:bacteriorhodopsin